MQFILLCSAPQNDDGKLRLIDAPEFCAVVEIEFIEGATARLSVGLIDDEGNRTKYQQGVDLSPHEIRAIGRAMINAAEFMEGDTHAA